MAEKTTYEKIVDALHGLQQATSPWNIISPTDVAGMLPGGGIPQAVDPFQRGTQKTAAARQAFSEGRYGDALMNYGSGFLDTATAGASAVPEMSPLLKLGGSLAAGLMSPTLYHATHSDFDKFKIGKSGIGSNAGAVGERAVFLTSKPEVADGYLGGNWVNMNSPKIGVGDAAPLPNNPGAGRHYSEGANIRPVVVNDYDDFEVWDMGGGGYRPEFMKQALKEARKNKAPGVVFENMRDPGIMELGAGKPSNVVAVLNPKLIDTAFAAQKSKK
jgi:hypothetical protein